MQKIKDIGRKELLRNGWDHFLVLVSKQVVDVEVLLEGSNTSKLCVLQKYVTQVWQFV